MLYEVRATEGTTYVETQYIVHIFGSCHGREDGTELISRASEYANDSALRCTYPTCKSIDNKTGVSC